MAPVDLKNEIEPEGRAAFPAMLRVFWVASMTAFGLMLLVGYVEFRMGFPAAHYNPLGGAPFEDLKEYLSTFMLVHSPAFFRDKQLWSPFSYPPLSGVLFALVYTTERPVEVYLATAAVWLAACVWGVRRALAAEGFGRWTATLFPLTIALVSFPIAGLLQRGNIELYVWIFAAAGSWAFLQGKDDAAAVLWGLAAAGKLYPIALLGLLLPRRRFGSFALGVATFVGVSALSMWWLGPTMGVAWHGSMNVFGYQGVRVNEFSLHELAANHSVFGLARLVGVLAKVPGSKLTMPYYVTGAALMALAFFGRLWKMPVANQMLGLSAFMVMLPTVSYFYTLVHLYTPWLMLVFVAIRAERAGVKIEGLKQTMLLFVPLFASFMLLTYPKVLLFGGLLQAVLLVFLFLSALQYPFQVGHAEKTRSDAAS